MRWPVVWVSATLAAAAVTGCDRTKNESKADPAEASSPGPPADEQIQSASPAASGPENDDPSSSARRPGSSDYEPPVERLASRVYWLDESAAVILAFELGSGQLEPTLDGTAAVLPELGGSLLDRIGFQQDDRVLTVAGREVADLPELRRAYETIADERDQFEVVLERGGERTRLLLRLLPYLPTHTAARDRAIDILAIGVEQTGDHTRRVDAAALGLLLDLVDAPSSQSQALELLGLPGYQEILAVADRPITAQDDIPEAFRSALEQSAFVVETKDGRAHHFELVHDTISDTDLELARDAVRRHTATARSTPRSDPKIHAAEVGTNVFEIRRDELQALMSSPADMAKLVRIIPSMKDGKTEGFKLYGIRPPSADRPFSLASVGFQSGDLVTSVNDHPLHDMDQAMKAFVEVRKADELRFAVTRGGSPLTIEIHIEGGD